MSDFAWIASINSRKCWVQNCTSFDLLNYFSLPLELAHYSSLLMDSLGIDYWEVVESQMSMEDSGKSPTVSGSVNYLPPPQCCFPPLTAQIEVYWAYLISMQFLNINFDELTIGFDSEWSKTIILFEVFGVFHSIDLNQFVHGIEWIHWILL
jgi:hypothetical protein